MVGDIDLTSSSNENCCHYYSSATISVDNHDIKETTETLSSESIINQQQHKIGDDYSSSTRKSPWNNTLAVITDDDTVRKHSQHTKTKFRQHVNPLKAQFRLPCDLPTTWPRMAYSSCNRPLYVDIGCGKGGFLLTLAAAEATREGASYNNFNFLGIEIRPSVVEYAQMRVSKRSLSGKLSFVGCNVNVDLNRLLNLYEQESAQQEKCANGKDDVEISATQPVVALVSIQFPDPHFKKRHKKRKVVDENLVHTLAKYTTLNEAQIFLQSDIQDVLDEMRQSFLEYGSNYFIDTSSEGEYIQENPIGIPTEREVSVLERGLPVYRCLFRRNNVAYPSSLSSA